MSKLDKLLVEHYIDDPELWARINAKLLIGEASDEDLMNFVLEQIKKAEKDAWEDGYGCGREDILDESFR